MIPFRDNIPSRLAPVVTVSIIVLNVLAFLYESRLSEEQLERFFFDYGFVPARVSQLITGKEIAVRSAASRRDGRPQIVRDPRTGMLFRRVPPPAEPTITIQPSLSRTLISIMTMMFLHGGWLHLIGNMWYLWIFGDNIEGRLGHGRFLIFYLAGGVAATASQLAIVWMFTPEQMTTPTLGASGAVAAVLGAYLVKYPHARVLTLVPVLFIFMMVELPAVILLGFWFVVQVFSGTASLGAPYAAGQGGVAWWAHIGGFVAGIALIDWLTPRLAQRSGPD